MLNTARRRRQAATGLSDGGDPQGVGQADRRAQELTEDGADRTDPQLTVR